MIGACVARLAFADEVVVGVDRRTTDDTAGRAAAAGARIVPIEPDGFAAMRNQLVKEISTEFVFFVDADERVTEELRQEVERRLAEAPAAYRLRIANWFYGHQIRRSGYRERPLRLLPTEGCEFTGDIHERPDPAGVPVRLLTNPLVHLSHRSVAENLHKTARYAEVQATELHRHGHRPVTRWVLMSVVLKGLLRHLIVGQGFRDGTAGFIESIYQPFSHFCVYVRLWELQQVPSIPERYHQLEEEVR